MFYRTRDVPRKNIKEDVKGIVKIKEEKLHSESYVQ